jgi:hypothetical protein
MHIKLRGIVLMLIFMSALNGFSQEYNFVSGKVIDSRTKEPLAFVNIVINNSIYGGTSDIDGKFKLRSLDKVRYLKLSYVGFQPMTYTVGPRIDNLVIPMVRTEIQLGEVEILPGINPAHRIIRNAVENREKNDPERLNSFSYTSYEKVVFTVDSDTTGGFIPADTTKLSGPITITAGTQSRNDTSKNTKSDSSEMLISKFFNQQYLFLMENVIKRKFLAPDKNYNQVIATRMSGFKDPVFVFLTTQIQSFSFYKPFISIFQSSYVNPISSGSLSKYFFKLEDTTYAGKDTVYIISFRPHRGTNFDGLKGVISISSHGWAIQNVIAEPYSKSQALQIKIQQMYELIDSTSWFPVQLNTDVTLQMLDIGGHHIIAKGRSYIRDIVLNPDMVRKEFNHLDVEVDKEATERNEGFWNEFRTDSLTVKDKKTYEVIDSIGKEANLDKVAKSFQTILSGRIPWKFLDFDLNRILGYNTYEGLILGLGLHTNDKVSDWFKIGGFYQYSFAISTSKYGGDASFLLNKRNDVSVRGGYFYDLTESGGVRFFDDYESILGGNFRPLLLKKLDRNESGNIAFTFRARKYWLFNVGLTKSFKQTTTDDLIELSGNDSIPRNDFHFTELTVALKWAYGEKFVQTVHNKISLGTNYPVVWIQYTKGLKNFLQGQYDYDRIDFKIRKTFKFKYFGKLTFQVSAGYIDRAIPACNLYYEPASFRTFTVYSPYSFTTMRMNEFLSNRYASLFIYHDFGYMLFKGKKWFHPEFALAQNIGLGWLDHPGQYAGALGSGQSMDLGYYETGLLINNLVNLQIYKVGVGAFYRWGPYGFKYAGNNFSYMVSVIFPF